MTTRFAALLVLVVLLSGTVAGQAISAALSGTVTDPAQSVIPNAKITLTNTASGDVRTTVTNSEGFYNFASIPVGSYDFTVEATGFQSNKVSGLAFSGAERRSLNMTLKIGQTSETVEVKSVAEEVIPVNSGDKSPQLNE